MSSTRLLGVLALLFSCLLRINTLHAQDRPNVIFILSDDHRYDFMGFTGKVPWLKTPAMDRMAEEGVHFEQAFVTTSLCSPSRASILTGMYSHQHTIVDNSAPDPGNLTYFPQYLQEAGYETAFFGKWHMGDHGDMPKPGFDHWVSFKGQGQYYGGDININGERITLSDTTYISHFLTQQALDWIENRDSDKPFFLYLSHKAVHSAFMAAPTEKGMYAADSLVFPLTYYDTDPEKGKAISLVEGKPNESYTYSYGEYNTPDWVKEQRVSWHGVDYMYHGRDDFDSFFRNYCETLTGLDRTVGWVLDYVEEEGLRDNTLIMYMGDNGFSFGEHGLIDKRHSYEESMRVPLLAYGPDWLKKGTTAPQMVQNVDIAPTVLSLAGVPLPEQFVGASMVPMMKGESPEGWRDRIFYEYYWEESFPQTPTQFAVRTDRYKYIRYHGVWDINEFYDLQADPYERVNLIDSPTHQEFIAKLRDEVYDWLEQTDGLQIPLKRKLEKKWDYRNKGRY